MKIIDLLNKIANGEEYPKIKFKNSIYEYHDKEHDYCRYYHDNTYICLDTDYWLLDILNDEVEIIKEDKEPTFNKIREQYGLPRVEEDKKIEKLDTKDLFTCDDYQNIKLNFALTWIKINEIIDYIMEDK